MKRFLSIILLSLAVGPIMAQRDIPVGIDRPEKSDTLPGYLRPAPDSLRFLPELSNLHFEPLERVRTTLAMPSIFALSVPRYTAGDMDLTDVRGAVTFNRWEGGGITVSGDRQIMPGYMGVESGRITIHQTFGNLTLSAFGEAAGYGYFRGMSTVWGFGGAATYRFNDKLSLTVYGAYYTTPSLANPMMAGYVNVPTFGGFFDYRFSDHWGIELGAETNRSYFTNRWETRPTVAPYYRTSNGAKFSVDVGSILYNWLNDSQHYGPVNPTIGPPVGGPPPVAPCPDKH